jgi:hypothetical protein
MYNIDFTEYDRTFSKNAVILEKCSFRDNVTIRLYYGFKLQDSHQIILFYFKIDQDFIRGQGNIYIVSII